MGLRRPACPPRRRVSRRRMPARCRGRPARGGHRDGRGSGAPPSFVPLPRPRGPRPWPAGPQRLVLARSPAGQQRLGELLDRLDSAAGFEQLDDAGAYQGDGRVLGPADRQLGDDLADAPPGDLERIGDLRLAGPGRGDGRVETQQCTGGALSRITIADSDPQRPLRQEIDAESGRVDRSQAQAASSDRVRPSFRSSLGYPAAHGGFAPRSTISRRVLLPTPRRRCSRRMGTVSRSSTVSILARSRALVARVPSPSSGIGCRTSPWPEPGEAATHRRDQRTCPARSIPSKRSARLAASPRRCRTAR